MRSRSVQATARAANAAAAFLAVLALWVGTGPAGAQDYPARPVRIIVPFATGGPADVYARFLAQRLQETLGQPFVVDDRPGAGSIVGTDAAAKSAPDGYTLLLMSNTHTVNETLIPNKPFSLTRDFVPIAPINYSDLVMVVHPSVKAKTLAEFIALAKAEPGKLNYASSGNGTPYHMAGELFKAMAGVDIVHVPYKGSSGARTDVIGGQVQMMFDAVTTMTEQVKAGHVRALGTSGKVRSTVLPDVPTISEAGVPGYEATIWLGLIAPRGTPPAIVNRLNAEITKIENRPEVKREWATQGAVVMTMTPEEFGKYIEADIVKWERIVKISGAKPDQ
ncbi:MAG TPA: tripartite tricarboxylate transporter substrate binding protein [Casimicrobiaceae bacterium]|nr:tripartite tricarboxylate transporter substrate binding protein [Casimicrobiaceae bacterium]